MTATGINNPAHTENDMEKAIRTCILQGFNHWNGSYDGWLEWCNTLYEPDAYYNVRGKHLTLQEYKDGMAQFFRYHTMELGELESTLIRGNGCVIRYTIRIKNLQTGEEEIRKPMEFIVFKHNPEPFGVRVAEGWALSGSPLSGD